MDDFLVLGVGIAPVIVALVQVVKPWVKDSRWYPVLTLLLGIVWAELLGIVSVFSGAASLSGLHVADVLARAVGIGVMAGLVASGLYGQLRVGKGGK